MLTSLLYSIIVAQKMIICWLAYLIVIVFLRGMMVLILYITNLASNEIADTKITVLTPLTVLILIILIYVINQKKELINKNIDHHSQDFFNLVYKSYNNILRETTLFIIVYLFVVLIVAVKIISLKKTPIKIK